VLALAAGAAPSASAQVPLAGTGENIQPIARVPISHPNEVELAGDWAFVSDDARDDDTGGLVIVNIANPEKPFIEGRWSCPGGWADIDLSADATIAVLSNGHTTECLDGNTAAVILDIKDKKNPKLLSRIEYEADMDYVHTHTLDNNLLYLNPQAAAFYPQGQNPHIPIFDISDPRNPVRKGSVQSTGVGLAHDTYIDHRPDGKDLMYAASVHTSDIFDVTDPFNATMIQRTSNPDITISHDVQPNFDRSIIIVDDEGAGGGQLDEQVSACGKAGVGPAAIDSGSVHFFAAAPDGTFAAEGAQELGSFNAPATVNEGACVAHVFWTAPNENRMTQAYYRIGGYVIDFSDPANAKSLGNFVAENGSNYWSFKPHRGYLFGTAQQDGGLDILKYTGEGGKGWPATAGPAEIQRAARQGVPYKPLTSPGGPNTGGSTVATTPLPGAQTATVDNRSIGRVKFTAKLKKVTGKKGKKTTIRFTFFNAKGKKVGSAKVKKAAGKKAKVRIFGGAIAGKYKWTAKVGKRTLGRGKFTVKKTAGMKLATTLTLSAGAK
jgi:hypothetical protein